MRRLNIAAVSAATWLLVSAIPAAAAEESLPYAHDNGEGFAGETTDKLVTYFSLGVVIFLAAFVVVMSLIQHRLESRHHDQGAGPKRAGW